MTDMLDPEEYAPRTVKLRDSLKDTWTMKELKNASSDMLWEEYLTTARMANAFIQEVATHNNENDAGAAHLPIIVQTVQFLESCFHNMTALSRELLARGENRKFPRGPAPDAP